MRLGKEVCQCLKIPDQDQYVYIYAELFFEGKLF